MWYFAKIAGIITVPIFSLWWWKWCLFTTLIVWGKSVFHNLNLKMVKINDEMNVLRTYFLHDRPWISPWIKSISNELDITCHAFASQLSGRCDVIVNRLWRHQQNVKRPSETRGWYARILVFNVIYSFVNSGNKHQNNPLVRAQTVRHASTNIILYFLIMRNKPPNINVP